MDALAVLFRTLGLYGLCILIVSILGHQDD